MISELSERHATNTFLTQAMTANDVIAQVKLIQDVMGEVMKKDEHFGVIPGTKKPSLYKAGAEKLCLLFRLAPSFDTTEQYDGQHMTVKSKCVLTHIPSGQIVGSGEAICSSKERKYAKRRDGTPNQDLPDTYNTVLKMANKRALVAATLVSTAASDIFTQDVEDMPTVIIDADAYVKDTKQTVSPGMAPGDAPQTTNPQHSGTSATAPEPHKPKPAPKADTTTFESIAAATAEGYVPVIVKKVAKKTGEKNGKAWTRHGIEVIWEGAPEPIWLNTFSDSFATYARRHEGAAALVKWEEKQNGQYTNRDLTAVAEVSNG